LPVLAAGKNLWHMVGAEKRNGKNKQEG